MSGKILVLGATGTVGGPLVSQLVAAGEPVKAASRKATPIQGAEAVHFDYGDPATFPAAFEGVDRAFVLVPSGYLNVLELLTPILQTAAERNVKVVLQTVLGVDADDNIPYRQAELLLERSGTPYVILRPNWFSDNFHTVWRAGIQQGVIALPAGDGKSSFIDARDIAASAAGALRSDEFNGRAFNLTGPEALSYSDAAAVLSQVAGRPVTYTPVTDDVFIENIVAAGVPREYAAFLASIFYPVREGWTAQVTGDVQTLTGQAPRSLETYARDHATDFVGSPRPE
jgi:uncharacterized protein YbjT (DUF2867 family)